MDNIIHDRLIKFQSVCYLCGYDKNEKIINNTYYKIYSNIKNPLFIFISFEFSNEKEVLVNNNLEVELREFIKLIIFNKQNIDYLLSPKTIYKNNFKLLE